MESDGQGISSEHGFLLSTEGAYFFNQYFGVGGEIGFQSFPNTVDNSIVEGWKGLGYEVLTQSTGNSMYYAGGYFQLPFKKNQVGAKILAGGIAPPNVKISLRALDQSSLPEGEVAPEYIYVEWDPKPSFGMVTGLYYKRILSKDLSMGFYFDYRIGDIKYDQRALTNDNPTMPVYENMADLSTNWDSWSIGMSLNVLLW